MSKSHGILTNFEGEKYEGEWKEGLLWNGTIMDEDGNIISKIANGIEVNILPTEVYSHIEWKENETATRPWIATEEMSLIVILQERKCKTYWIGNLLIHNMKGRK